MTDFFAFINKSPIALRMAIFAGLAVATHLLVIMVRRYAKYFLVDQSMSRHRKLQSVLTLTISAVVFSLYFFAIGLILREFGVSLTAYLASASVLGLAVGFGSQGIVQDVVTGLTLIFSDLIDVGDLVEISGQTGIVRAITMRFVEMENALGATVFIPNRTISNIVNYPRGYVRCIVDITLRGDEAARANMESIAVNLMNTTCEQFPGILMKDPSSENRITLNSGKQFLRIKFRIWPNRGQPIETTYLQELLNELKQADADYQPWMIAINYEVERKNVLQRTQPWPWRNRGGKKPSGTIAQ